MKHFKFALVGLAALAGATVVALLLLGAVGERGGTVAHAAQPLDVDCDLLAATNDAVDVFLDDEGVLFDNLGDLYSSAIQDQAVFEQLSDLILFFSGGAIQFDSATQTISTNGKCGLAPQLLDNLRN